MNDADRKIEHRSNRRLTTVVATDLVQFTRSVERNEELAVKAVGILFDLFNDTARSFEGRVFSKAGDGFLAEFPSALNGLNAALSFARRVELDITPAHGLKARIGLHVGDVIEQPDGDLLGHGVNVAARLQELALPNQVLASANIMSLVGHAFQGRKVGRGELVLKNVSAPVRAYDLIEKKRLLPRLPTARWWQSARPSLVTALVCLLLVLPWLNLDRQDPNTADWLTERTADLEAALMEGSTQRQIADRSDGISPAYIRSVLESLAASGRSTSRPSMAMILEGDVESAIQLLEADLEQVEPGDPEYIEILHQIGALSYFTAPQKAVAVYEVLSLVDPEDPEAMVRRGQVYDVVNMPSDAERMYQLALSQADISQERYVALQLDLAFNQILTGNPQNAVDILKHIETQMTQIEDVNLESRYLTELGIALERMNELEQAEANLIAALALQERFGFDTEASRSYNVLGLIADKRASAEPDQSSAHLNHAREMFRNQFEIDRKLGRQHGIAEAQYYLASIALRLKESGPAHTHALQALRLSSEHGLPNIEFLSWLIMAELAVLEGDQDQACVHVQSAESLYRREIQSAIGPRTAQIIETIGCPFDVL